MLVLAWALGAGGAVAQWTPEVCNDAIKSTIAQLTQARDRLEQIQTQLAEAQRKGDQKLIDASIAGIENAREVGIKQQLRYIDTQPLKYCLKSGLDASLLAQVDTFRPLAEESSAAPAVEAERAPAIEIAGVTATLVPTVPREGGGCTGPYLDLAVTLQNRGGVFPRPADMEARLARLPTAESEPYFIVNVDFDFGNGKTAYQQILVMKSDLPGGVLAGGAAVDAKARMVLASGYYPSADVSVRAGVPALLTINGTATKTPVFTTAINVPMWDIYTQSTQTVSPPDPKSKGRFEAGIQATIINRGASPTPGPVRGSFTVRHEPGGPELAHLEGATDGPIAAGGTDMITEYVSVPNKVESPIVVDSQIFLLCPDGAFGVIVDGNEEDNARTLKER